MKGRPNETCKRSMEGRPDETCRDPWREDLMRHVGIHGGKT